MRSPSYSYDISILQDEPFVSWLRSRCIQGTGSRSHENSITDNIAAEVERTEGGPSAVSHWMFLAFGQTPPWPPNRRHTALFVDFFWRLERNLIQDATELIKANRASLEVHNRLETLRTRPQRKAPQRARQLNVRPVAGLSSPWIATPVREEISEPPKKIRRLERPASSRETTTSVLNIRIPVVSQPQNRGSAPRGRPRKNPVLEQAAVNSSFVSTIPAETAYHGVDNRSLSRERPRKTPKKSMSSSHFPLTFPKLYQTLPALELTVLHTSLLPHTTYATDHQDKDKCMVMCDIMPAIPQNLSYEWPASRTGLPTIWSQTRQEMCETLPWFRSFHGGVYQKDGVAKGYMLGRFGSERDCFLHGGKLIISHGGGGRPEMKPAGSMTVWQTRRNTTSPSGL